MSRMVLYPEFHDTIVGKIELPRDDCICTIKLSLDVVLSFL